MDDSKVYVAHYVKRLVGPDSEDAYHSLIEAGEVIVPHLIEAFRVETNPTVRSILVEIVGQYRLSETAEFLAEALTDSISEVWKSALDGLVTLGGSLAIQMLKSAKQHFQANGQTKAIQVEWINEAIQQVEDCSQVMSH